MLPMRITPSSTTYLDIVNAGQRQLRRIRQIREIEIKIPFRFSKPELILRDLKHSDIEIVCVEGIVLTGSIGSATEPFNFEDEINKYFKNKYELKVISKESGAIGAAQIACDVYNGEKEILGIEVDY